ncbi:uncharacterized protein B0I36DRAFT_415727 [Microdochium trichocladiopsis]|uniref:NAD-dependent epimerase/dehydratase domain-containing protein n=1 Tax=Microdochium trichocladiopsis TaxID=1682393 RepID=A0A9P8XX36_9PEZI|nr:uncharacterized protein B0I36DRAFT_415727 [Microdochium trichocladiopsis]KAH7024436.1 hypothetical protein B0I36DRAFT_415727 [Microdochium trichocladiopsis]
MSFELAIRPGDLVLITGATGSVGGAVANEILKAGYRVRALVRDETKAGYLREAFHARYGQAAFETRLVQDPTVHTDLVDAMQVKKGCAGVVHMASNTSLSPDPEVVIPSSVNLATAMLRAAAATPTIKRFVFTSSTSTLPPFLVPINNNNNNINSSETTHSVTVTATGPDSWASEETVQKGWAKPYSPANAGAVYASSKILSERACWEFVAAEKPSFVLNTVVPATQIGELVHPSLVSSANGLLWKIWKGGPDAERVKGLLHFVRGSIGVGGKGSCLLNLSDSGLLHLAALTHADVQGERVLGIGEVFDGNDVIDFMKRMDPGRDLPAKVGSGGDVGASEKIQAVVDRSQTLELLARFGRTGFVGLEESLRQMVASGSLEA